ncbi:hypothetical protein GGR50DRAFT_699026, partial [Xylaria sp. CBS 124048]
SSRFCNVATALQPATLPRSRNFATSLQPCYSHIAASSRYRNGVTVFATLPRPRNLSHGLVMSPRPCNFVTILQPRLRSGNLGHDLNYLVAASSLRYNSATLLQFCNLATIL